MTDNEIIKVLECCLKGCNAEGCDNCPLYEKVEDCEIEIPIIALALINRQKEEIEKSQSALFKQEETIQLIAKEKREYFYRLQTAKAEAIREFAERLKSTLSRLEANLSNSAYKYVPQVIDNLIKTMTEDNA